MRRHAIWIVIAATAAVVLVVSRVTVTDRNGHERLLDDRNASPIAASSVPFETLTRNPVRELSEQINQAALDRSLECISPDGLMTCGKYLGHSALYYSVLSGRHDMLQALATREMLETFGQDALAVAAALGDLTAVKMLVERGAYYGFFNKSALQRHPLFPHTDGPDSEHYDVGAHPATSAADFGYVDVLSYFIDAGFDVNAKFADGYQDLFSVALLGRRINVIEHLINNGYEIDCSFRFPKGTTYMDVAKTLKFREAQEVIQSACTQRHQTASAI